MQTESIALPADSRLPVDEVMTPAEAAKYLHLTVGHLSNLRGFGCGPRYCKLGRAVRYRLADLREWVAAKSVTSTSAVA